MTDTSRPVVVRTEVRHTQHWQRGGRGPAARGAAPVSARGPRRWALSALDRRSHVLADDDQARPPGSLVALCSHVMPCSAPISGAEPGGPAVCGTCEALANGLQIPAPAFPAAGELEPTLVAQPRLSVLISRRTEVALQEVRANEGVSFTEALRRLVGYGHAVYAAQRAGREIVLRGGGQPTERLRPLLDPPQQYGLGPVAAPGTDTGRQRRGRHERG